VPLPKSEKEGRMRENADIFDFELSAEDMKMLETGKYETTIWDPTTDTS
jgi:diketogulonate reductase-like aldo/keto reductase